MAIRDLFFSIFAKDKTAEAFASVNRRLRETEGHAASTAERLDRMGKSMAALGAAGSVASAGIMAAFSGSIDLYDTQARAEAKVRTAIEATGGSAGFTAEQLGRMASEMQAVTRFGDEAILDGVTAQFLTFKNLAGETFERAQWAAADLATVLNADLMGTAIMLGKALNDPVAGIGALAEAGVTFTEGQKQVVAGLMETGQIAEAQKLILDEIASAYGGQALAAAQAGAGVRDQWRNTWGDIKEIVGSVLLDGMKAILPPLQALASAFMALSPSAQRFVVIAGTMTVALPPLIAGLGLVVAGLAAVSAPVLAVVAGVGLATAAVAAFWPEISKAAEYVNGMAAQMTLFEKLFAPITLAVRMLWDGFSAVFPNIAGLVSGTVDGIVDAIRGRFMAIMDAMGAKVDWVHDKFAWLYDRVVGNSWVPDLVEEIGKSFGELDAKMVAPTNAAADSVNQSFRGLLGDVGGSLKQLAMDGELTFGNFLGALSSAANRQVDQIVGQAFDRLADAGANALASAFSGGGAGAAGGGAGGGLLSGLATAARGLLGFDTGGAFTVRGRAGTDRNVAAVRLSEGERVEVLRRGQSGRAVNVTLNISTPDADSFRRSRAQIAAEARAMLAFAERGA